MPHSTPNMWVTVPRYQYISMARFPNAEESEHSQPEQPPESTENRSLEEELGETVVNHLRESPAVQVWYTGETIQIEQVEREIERQRTATDSSASPPQSTDQNRTTAPIELAREQPSNRDSALPSDGGAHPQRANGISNVQNLTEKQAKVHLLLEQTGGEISTSELAERAGYSSKSGAHSAKEKWLDETAPDD
ncbi:hypothetical protein [Halosimplex sp. TS25]|uniref:hypothetical protein n=1 Tax=Halosimplex rarum TaxID=3396619 RepID=UPI0039EC564B